MKKWFTSDLHFNDSRFDLLYRPFTNLKDQHETLINNWNAVVSDEDEVYIVGDFSVDDDGLKYVNQLKGKKILIVGNYDEPRGSENLEAFFDKVYNEGITTQIGEEIFYLNHYPEKASKKTNNLVGHVHGLWRVQRNMINVSTEAWNYTPVSEEQILLCLGGIKEHYDVNVFAGEVDVNIPFNIIHSVEPIKLKGHTVFLAGPTPRNHYTPSWRSGFIAKMKEMGFKGTILTPETKIYKDNYNYDLQVEWEDEGLSKADIIVFWIPRELKEMPGFTTNVEFGEWMKSGKVILGYPKGTVKINYLDYKARKFGVPVFHETKDVISEVINKINKGRI